MKLFQQNISFSDELDIESPKLTPIISYPHFSAEEYYGRISEMRSLGIRSISLAGKTVVNGLPVAGKGCVGIVVRARIDNSVCALKIRRIDADRKNMDAEVRFHQIANAAGVGPSLKGHTKNIIAMGFAEGTNIIKWADHTTKGKARSVTRAILEQCLRLDKMGLDHGELSRLDRHIVVYVRPVIIDFESASTVRKTCNVTAAAQSIFLYGPVATHIQKILGTPDREQVIKALKRYKQDQSDTSFGSVLDLLPV